MQAWTFQEPKMLAKLGADKCRWSVGWYDPSGKRKQKVVGSKSAAENYRRKKEGELAAGLCRSIVKMTWESFRKRYETEIGPTLSVGSQGVVKQAFDQFQKLMAPARLDVITTSTVDSFIARRRAGKGRRPGSTVSPASINKELRHLKAAFKVAHEWGCMPVVPKVRMLKEPQKLARFVTVEHFTAIYDACDKAQYPTGLACSPAEWWRALVTFAYMTGWRIGECLALRRDDVDLANGRATTRARDNKGKRDEVVPLHPLVVEHLREVVGFSPLMLPWGEDRRTLYAEYHRIQREAGIHLDCHEDHEHTDACHAYGFHDLRRAFATMNAANLSGDVLQRLMRHKSYTTTQRYINLASQVNSSVAALFVPELNRKQA